MNLCKTYIQRTNQAKPIIINDKVGPYVRNTLQLDKARSRELGGTGLGLAIVKHILIKHRATLEIISHLKESTCFSITFPLA